MVLICIPITNKIQHFLLCLLAINIPSSVLCLFMPSAHFLTVLFFPLVFIRFSLSFLFKLGFNLWSTEFISHSYHLFSLLSQKPSFYHCFHNTFMSDTENSNFHSFLRCLKSQIQADYFFRWFQFLVCVIDICDHRKWTIKFLPFERG